MTKTKAKYIGENDPEFRKGNVYMIFALEEFPSGEMIAAENDYGEAYVMPANLFEIIE